MNEQDREVESALAVVAERLGALAKRNVPLGAMTTFRVGGNASLFVVAETIDVLVETAGALHGITIPTLVLGRGSNLLVADDGFQGLVVQLGAIGERIEIDGTTVRAGGSVLLPVLARRTAAAGLSGLEWAVGVPGSVGGGVRMNAGGHGSDVAASLASAKIFDLVTGALETVDADRLGLRFRGSGLADNQIVVDAEFRTTPGDARVAEAQLSEIVRWRREHQPGGQNCGSVFVNPIPGQLAAAQLIDRLGLRGHRIGTAFVSEKHANFIQGTEDGRAGDVRTLIEFVRQRVVAEFGILLRSEVCLVGFDDDEESIGAADSKSGRVR